MQKIIILLLLSVATGSAFGQMEAQNPQQQAMQKLAFLAGKWSGSGWQMGQNRQRHTFTQTEDISFAAGGEALVVKGQGKSKDPDTGEEKIIHHAVALITYAPEQQNYDFRSYAAGRGAGNFQGQLIKAGHFEWQMDTPNGKVRYTILLNEQGQWFEKGEFAIGDSWFQFFEMTLDKVE